MKKIILAMLAVVALSANQDTVYDPTNSILDGLITAEYQQTWNPAGDGYVNTCNPAA